MTSPPRPAATRGADRSPDPDVERRVRESFDRQQFMHTLGARLIRVAPGEIDIELPVRPELGQQNGFVHAGAVSAVADSACGYAAMSLTPPDADVLSI
jgi:acyl-coenzyme A thioesterase PaaI-like protein